MKKKKTAQSFAGVPGDGDSYITFGRLWREERGKKKMQIRSRCICGAQTCMKNMHHTSRNSSRIL